MCLVYFAQDLYHWLATPLLDTLPENAQMIATDVASPFFAPFQTNYGVVIFYCYPSCALPHLGVCSAWVV